MDWIKFFKDYNIPYQHKDSNRVICNCPHHTPKDVDLFMRVYPTGSTTCWYCGSHSPIKTISAYLDVSYNQAVTVFNQYKDGKSYFISNYIPPKEFSLPLKDNFTKTEQLYLQSRGITQDMIEQYDIRSGNIIEEYKHRIWFPIYHNNQLVSARGRSIVGMEPKYMAIEPSLELIPHKHTLYGSWLCYGQKIGVLEGEIDTIRSGSGFVSTYGTQVTDAQIILLSKYAEVMMIFDNDDGGRQAVDKVGNKLAVVSNTKVEAIYIDSKYKDNGSMPIELIKEIKTELWG